MLKIIYSNESYINIDKFISYLKDYYKKMYFDTGIASENQIVSNYIEKTENLFDEIINKIEQNINIGYFGEVIDIKNSYELSKLIIQIRSYNIKIIIKKEKTKIIIENIYIS